MALAEARPVSLALADGAARHSFARIAEVAPIPNLIKVQRDSFDWFLREGLKELFAEISPIQDFTGRNMDLELAVPGPDGEPGYSFGLPKMTEDECREHDVTFAAPLKVRMRLKIKSGENAGEIKEQDIFMGDFPLMTDQGTFIINGAERVVVSQLVRSPGVYFTVEDDLTSGRDLCMGKLIPSRGAWLEFDTSSRDVMSVKVDRKRKIPVTTLLRALPRVVPEFTAVARGTDEEILKLFEGVDEGSDHRFVQSTLDKDPASNSEEALLEFYRRLRPGDPPNADNARSLLNSLFFNFRRYDLGKVGRYKVNKRLGLQTDITVRILTPDSRAAVSDSSAANTPSTSTSLVAPSMATELAAILARASAAASGAGASGSTSRISARRSVYFHSSTRRCGRPATSKRANAASRSLATAPLPGSVPRAAA